MSKLICHIIPFFIALQFLTRIPIDLQIAPTEKQIGQSTLYYPAVGFLIGVILVALHYVLTQLLNSTNELLNASLLLATWIFITGALHFDGLADSADALVGGFANKEKTLTIMKDPCSGPIAVVVLICVLLMQFSALTTITSQYYLALLLIPLIARSTVLILFLTTPYTSKNGIAETLVARFPKKSSFMILLMQCILLAVIFKSNVFILLIGVSITLYLLRKTMMKRLGGMTGDTIGANIVIIETVSLLILTI